MNEDVGVREKERESPPQDAQASQVTPASLAELCLPLETPGVPGSGRFAPGRGGCQGGPRWCCSALQWTMPPCPTPSQTQELAVPFLCLETPGSNSSLPTRLKSGSKSLP